MTPYKIEIYEDPLKLKESEFEYYFTTLPQERREKVLNYRRKIDRNLSLLAYVLLRQGLHKWYGIEQNEFLRFEYNQYAKPSLADYPHIYFNISHCQEAVVCVFADQPIGVDVEGVIEYDEDLVRYVANADEYIVIANAKDLSLAFTNLWTKKESYMKMIGTGLDDDLHSVLNALIETEIYFEHIYSQEKKYVLCVCTIATI